jgi:ribosomal protein L21E
MSKFRFEIGDAVQLGRDGTTRFPIPARYAGRRGTVVDRTRSGNTVLYGVDFTPRRVEPLFVTQGSLV